MALSDPQSVNLTGTAASLPRTGGPVNGSGSFQSNDGTLSLEVKLSNTKRSSGIYRATIKKYSPNPLDTSVNVPVNASVFVGFNRPLQGFTVAEMVTALNGLVANLQAGTNANLQKFLGGES
ncbi:TPA_asm: coat protein [ssRNA phage Esthiorhiza.1_7]|uniref:Coat protein n=3 Tax=Leviviricetes TaxID=2842243 RepID=A0A8S5L2K6_9VIRU|nr:coat protein [ssRNA phage Esthiorhiza.1_7]QDH87412.1 MAG: hypothetical protein H1RhizoLitter1350_000002 [Leviviridae sp.]DAD51652.1 TPA_asm: coat protein [ssRNA phage Esthiorhiza.1_7]